MGNWDIRPRYGRAWVACPNLFRRLDEETGSLQQRLHPPSWLFRDQKPTQDARRYFHHTAAAADWNLQHCVDGITGLTFATQC